MTKHKHWTASMIDEFALRLGSQICGPQPDESIEEAIDSLEECADGFLEVDDRAAWYGMDNGLKRFICLVALSKYASQH